MTGRDIYWNIGDPGVIRYFAAAALAVFSIGIWRRVSLWRRGRPAGRNDRARERVAAALRLVLGQERILRRRLPGAAHLAVFWGMAALFAGTVVVALESHFAPGLLRGGFYRGFKLALDTAGLAVLAGASVAVCRRFAGKGAGAERRAGDAVVPALLAGIALSGLLVEALRIAATADPLGAWSPAGNLLAELFRGTAPGVLRRAHRFAWTAHAVLAFGLIAGVPFSGMRHVFAAPLSTVFRPLTPAGALDRLDLEDEGISRFGAGTLEEFTWKDLLDTDACVRCGRCEDRCPAHATGKPLSPMTLIRDLGGRLSAAGPGRGGPSPAPLAGVVADEDALWACTTCGSCAEQCPVFVEHVPKIVGMRRSLVMMESRFPPELIPVFRNMECTGNPWGLGRAKREEWANGLGVDGVSKGRPPEVLFWVGCAAAFDDRNRRVASAVAGILRHAGVGFAVLGTEELCCGDSARRLGNEFLFQSLARRNVDTLNAYGVRKIVTACPHCFNALKNEYPQFGGDYEVVHHAEFIAGLAGKGLLEAKPGRRGVVTYQDPCYAGRYNDVYREPREIIGALGFRLAEMPGHSRESVCCGAGGGRMWMEERLGDRINVRRAEQALAVDPEAVVTACPFCLTMMEDGIKLKGRDGRIRTVDLAELVAESIRR